MSDLPRPRQVTTAGVMGVAGSVLVILSLFDTLASLSSLDVREKVDAYLETPQGRGLGVSTAWVLDALHVMVLVNGALAAVAAVLGVFVFQRHKGARLGFTVSAALLFIGMWVVADFVQGVLIGVVVVVAFAASMMWSPPARDWFAGRAPVTDRGPVRGPGTASGGPSERPDPFSPPAPPSAAWPPPGLRQPEPPTAAPSPEQPAGHPGESGPPEPASYPFGQSRPPGIQAPWGAPAPQGHSAAGPSPDRRPGAVVAAAVITWVCAGLVGLSFGLLVLMLLVSQDTLLEAVRQNPDVDQLGLSGADMLSALWVSGAVALFWCLAAVVLAVLAFRRVTWAWALLVASAVMTTLVGLLALPPGLTFVLPAAVTVGLLLSGRSRRWYLRRQDAQPPSGPGQSGPPSYGGASYPGPDPAGAPVQQPPPASGKPPVW
jgi:hypothetical protein